MSGGSENRPHNQKVKKKMRFFWIPTEVRSRLVSIALLSSILLTVLNSPKLTISYKKPVFLKGAEKVNFDLNRLGYNDCFGLQI